MTLGKTQIRERIHIYFLEVFKVDGAGNCVIQEMKCQVHENLEITINLSTSIYFMVVIIGEIVDNNLFTPI